MAKATADIESATTGHERAQEDLKNLQNRGGTSAHIGDGSTKLGDPPGLRHGHTHPGEKASGAAGGHHEESDTESSRNKG